MNQTNHMQITVVRDSRGLSVSGTRITLYNIMDYLKAGWPPHLIQQWFDLSDQQIADVMAYIQTHQEEVEVEYQQVVQEAEEHRQYWEKFNTERFAQIANLPVSPQKEAIRRKIQAKKAELGMA